MNKDSFSTIILSRFTLMKKRRTKALLMALIGGISVFAGVAGNAAPSDDSASNAPPVQDLLAPAMPPHGSGPSNNPGIKLKKGAKLYVDNCAICHGDNGNADTRAAGSLNPPPRNFTTIQTAMELTRERMIESVTNGRPGTAMMAHKDRLSGQEIEDVVDFIRENFMRTPTEVEIPQELQQGQKIYSANCAVCHGDKGNTALWARSGLNPPPRDFTSERARKELTRERMIHSVTNGRPGTGMMPFKSKLSNEEIGHVVDFIRATFIRADQPHTSAAMTDAPLPADALHSNIGNAANAMPGLSGNPHAPGRHAGVPMGMLPGAGAMSMSPPGFESMAAADMSKPMPLGLKGDMVAGRAFFMNNCFTCHGVTGEGNGPRADFNIPRPRNFTSEESRRMFNRERLFKSISNGKVGTVMPAWSRVLTPQQIADVAEFVFQAFIMGKGSDVKAENSASPDKKKP